MKKIFSIISLTFLCFYNAQAQLCRQIDIAPDTLRKRILRQFIDECHRGRYFVEDKGIVTLTAYQDSKGRELWSIYAMIDDRYKENPPTAYSTIGDDIILVYSADSMGRTSGRASQNIASINRCLEDVILNRIYQRPLVKERFVEIVRPNGKIMKTPVKTIIMGNYWNGKKIIFNRDGTYKIFTGV